MQMALYSQSMLSVSWSAGRMHTLVFISDQFKPSILVPKNWAAAQVRLRLSACPDKCMFSQQLKRQVLYRKWTFTLWDGPWDGDAALVICVHPHVEGRSTCWLDSYIGQASAVSCADC